MREQSTTNNIFQPKHVRGGETKVMKAMKKSILTFLAFALVFTMAMPAFAANVATGATYSDIQDGKVADAVKVLSSLEVLKGYPDGTFKPDNTITRAEFAAVAVRLLGYEKAAQASQGKTAFKDEVLPWASGYVNVASQQKILTGYPDKTFRANQPVTQAEALTILVRALGYEPVVDKAGWPYNYLVIADQIGLTKDLAVVANEPATRGFVAQITSTSVAKPKLVQTGFGDMKQFVVSGTNGTDEKTILSDNLGYKKQANVVTEIPRVNSKLDDNEIKLVDKDGKDLIVNVPEGFDFEAALGTKLTYYVDKDDNVIYAKAGDVKYDAIKVTKASEEIKLIDADKKYDLNKDAIVFINGKPAKVADLTGEYSYAKVALNDKDEVRFVEAYTFSFMVVEKVDNNVVLGYGDEINIKDYTFVKDGKTINAEDLVQGDILYFNISAKFAEVYNNNVSGEIERVFTDLIRVSGEDYEFDNAVKYLDDDSIASFNKDTAAQMQDEGNVTLYLDRAGNLVFVSGKLGKLTTTTFAGYLTDKIGYSTTDARGNVVLAIDLVTQSGEVKNYTKTAANLEIDAVKAWGVVAANVSGVVTTPKTDWDQYTKAEQTAITNEYFKASGEFDTAVVAKNVSGLKGDVVKVKVNDSNEVVGLFIALKANSDDMKSAPYSLNVTKDKYVQVNGSTNEYKVKAETYVFMVEKFINSEKAKDVSVVKWADIKDFEKIEAANGANISQVYFDDKGYVTYIVAVKTNLDDSDKKLALVTDIRDLRSADEYRLTAFVDGKETSLYTTKDAATGVAAAKADSNYKNKGFVPVEVSVSKKTGEVTGLSVTNVGTTAELKVLAVSTANKTITIDNAAKDIYRIVSDAVVFDATSKTNIKLSQLNSIGETDLVVLAPELKGTKFISMVILTKDNDPEVTTPDVESFGTVEYAYTHASDTSIRVNVNGTVKSFDLNINNAGVNKTLVIGKDNKPLNTKDLVAGTKVNVTLIEGTNVVDIIKAVELDDTLPALKSAKVNGTKLVLTYDEALKETVVPATADYTVAGITGVNVTGVAVSGTTVTLTLDIAATSVDTITVSYVPSTGAELQDLANNKAASLTTEAVVNDTP